MKSCSRVSHGLAVLVLLFSVVVIVLCEDLYKTLGVSRTATTRDIKSAYKRLAMKWHPDKNKSPRAQEKITQLNRAYEILSDKEKRQHYDNTGDTGESPNVHRGPTMFQTGNVFHFHFGRPSGPRADNIATETFYNDILPNSDKKVFLLNFYHDMCFQCADVAVMWSGLRRVLEPSGIGMGSVHAMQHSRIARHCGVSRIPSIVAVVSGRMIHYQGSLESAAMQKFIESILPSGLVAQLDSSSTSAFLSLSIRRNRPRAVLFTQRSKPSLAYKLVALANRRLADFGFISSLPPVRGKLLERFGVSPGERKLLVFKEFPDTAASVYQTQLTPLHLNSIIEGLSLFLPRLSAPHLLDLACPVGGVSSLCAVLLVSDQSHYNDSITGAFRGLARTGASTSRLTVHFAYIDSSKQARFMSGFAPVPAETLCDSGESARPVLLLHRTSSQHVLFDWFLPFCGNEKDIMLLREHFAVSNLREPAILDGLEDEEAPGLLGQAWEKVIRAYQNISDFISALDSHIFTPLVTLSVSAIFFCLVSLFAGNQEPQQRVRNQSTKFTHNPKHEHKQWAGTHSVPDVARLYKLTEESYLDSVVSARKGQVTLVLVLSTSEQEEARRTVTALWRFIGEFRMARLTVFYQYSEGKRQWIHSMLQCCPALGEREVETWMAVCVDSDQLLSCAIAFFGARKQFCIFPELALTSRHSNGHIPRTGTHLKPHSHNTVGSILEDVLGLSSDDVESDSEVGTASGDTSHMTGSSSDSEGGVAQGERAQTSQERVPVGFTVWLERLADGSLPRYSVDEWPSWQ